MPDCELQPTCPFFRNMKQNVNELTAFYKEHYCQGNYAWCGRYMAFKALERELKLLKSTLTLISQSKGDK